MADVELLHSRVADLRKTFADQKETFREWLHLLRQNLVFVAQSDTVEEVVTTIEEFDARKQSEGANQLRSIAQSYRALIEVGEPDRGEVEVCVLPSEALRLPAFTECFIVSSIWMRNGELCC